MKFRVYRLYAPKLLDLAEQVVGTAIDGLFAVRRAHSDSAYVVCGIVIAKTSPISVPISNDIDVEVD